MVFPLLDFIGFDATGSSNSAEDIRALAILYGGPSILFKLAAVAMMHNFPIDEAEHGRIRSALAASGQH
jgi:Na+/melibiose symporter-like transporter